MELYLDSANLQEIKEAFTLEVITGLTTTPTFMHKEGIKNIDETILQLAATVPILQIEALGNCTESICEEAHRLIGLGLKKNKTVFKIPVNNEGIKACKYLTDNGFLVNIHLVYTLQQAYMAMLAKATYICPLVGRLQDQGHDALALLKQCVAMVEKYQSTAKIMFSSVRNTEHIRNALNIGVHACTVPWKVLQKMNDNHFTTLGLQQFVADTHAMTLKVKEVMTKVKPIVSLQDTLSYSLVKMTQSGLGIIVIVDETEKIKGVYTDGDLRRYLEKNTQENITKKKMAAFDYKVPIFLYEEALLSDAIYLFQKHTIDNIIILDTEENLVGILDIQHLIQKNMIKI